MDGLDFERKGVSPDHNFEYKGSNRGFVDDIIKDLKDGDDAIGKTLQLIN